MSKRVQNFNSYLTLLVSVIGVQLLLLPFYHLHVEQHHSHTVGSPSHKHNAYFHSIELESIVNLAHSHDHNSDTDHHSHHSESNDENDSKIGLNKDTIKSKKSFKVLKVFSTFTSSDITKKFKTYYLSIKLPGFSNLAFQQQLRERSPPSYYL
jgi:hypothetical protein